MTVYNDMIDGLNHALDRKHGITPLSCGMESQLVRIRLLCRRGTPARVYSLGEQGFRDVLKREIIDGVVTCFGCLSATP